MKVLILLLAVSGNIYAFEKNLENLLINNPIQSIEKIKNIKDSDDKFAGLYKAESIIASKSNWTYFYQDKINLKGFYDKMPGKYERYVMKNSARFNSASEGMYAITAKDYWLKKIKNQKHSSIGDYKFSVIHNFDEAVWDDGDGTMHNKKLISDYKEWIEAFPNHEKVNLANKRIKFMNEHRKVGN
jgi:hypothetical protein